MPPNPHVRRRAGIKKNDMNKEQSKKWSQSFSNIELKSIELKPKNYGYPDFSFLSDLVYDKFEECLLFSNIKFEDENEKNKFESYCRNRIEGMEKSYDSIRP